eukprot:GHVR01115887.1.p1 GENE.GHVR01115887.1~~GHVR01115887.1.p1  ORF type:complete len:239 (+),score=46.24 GHVR01115887.1:89-805(+)
MWNGAFPANFDRHNGSRDQDFNNLRRINWNQENLSEFKKDFYTESPSVSVRTESEVKKIRLDKAITIVNGNNVPKPIISFEEANFPKYLNDAIKLQGYTTPTPIQIQGFPVALSGRDMIGIAETGSGKTCAFLLPGIIHMKAQQPLKRGDGPIVLVLAPTRELAMQIANEAEKFGAHSRVKCACVYGGAPKQNQVRQLRDATEIVIATPGRLLDFLNGGETNLTRVTYLVLDEADRHT